MDIPTGIGITAYKHLLSVIAVESGLAVMHIVGTTPEAPNLETALSGKKPLGEYTVDRKALNEAYALANTAKGRDIDFVFLGCPHVTLREFRDLAQVLDGKKIHKDVKLIVSTDLSSGLLLCLMK